MLNESGTIIFMSYNDADASEKSGKEPAFSPVITAGINFRLLMPYTTLSAIIIDLNKLLLLLNF